MNKTTRYVLIAMLCVLLIGEWASQSVYNNYKKSQELYCAVDGYNYKKIDKLKVTEYSLWDFPFLSWDTWYFTNGWSTNCYLRLTKE